MFWRDALCTSAECRRGKAPGEPYDGKRPVRFDEVDAGDGAMGEIEMRHRHLGKAAG